MSLNCRPGDMAVIRGCVYDADCNGMLVEVVSALTGNEWTAPDGSEHAWSDSSPTYGVVSLGSPFLFNGEPCMYAAFDARVVFPIRPQDDDADCESKAWLPPVPHKETA